EGGAVRRQVVGQGPPDAAVAGLVEDGVDDLPAGVLSRPAAGLGPGGGGLDQPPLGVRQGGRVAGPAHTAKATDRALLDKLSEGALPIAHSCPTSWEVCEVGM